MLSFVIRSLTLSVTIALSLTYRWFRFLFSVSERSASDLRSKAIIVLFLSGAGKKEWFCRRLNELRRVFAEIG
jgi:hypothetical protein